MKNKFYLTTTLPYVNAEPHVGFALEIIQADAIARWHRLNGEEVFFNTGTDEHGLKIYRKAQELKMDPQKYCDEYTAKFDDLKKALNLSYNNFIRTTDKHHLQAAQEFWRGCEKNGDIYKKNYKVKYCVGCELEKTESELNNDGRCPMHPNLELEIIEEENYFFRYSKYQKQLLELYKNNPDFVLPQFRLKEIIKFTERGLEDFSISRLKEKMPWGVAVPGDEKHVMYVWFDALVNYISAIGYPDDSEWKKWWPAMQIAGKDNLRQQASMWQAMLMSAGYPPSKQILIHGFLTSGGQKISKSAAHATDPFEYVNKFGTDALRYYLLAKVSPFEDSDFTLEKFQETYVADLANGLGNLVARVSNLLEKNNLNTDLNHDFNHDKKFKKEFDVKMSGYKFNEALEVLWKKLRACDEVLTKKEPWKFDDKDKIKKILEPVAQDILNVAELLQPFMPSTAEKIMAQFSEKQIKKGEVLFPRIG